jgi:C1A family cysteine protease
MKGSEEKPEELEGDRTYRFGWLPDYPDFRDYREDLEKLQPVLEKTSVSPKPVKGISLPSSVDLREWCSDIENQKNLGSCTAHAGVGVIEYFERKAFGKHLDASRLFLYKATRNLMHWTGDTGAFLRTTMGAMRLFGVPPEEYWPYTDSAPDFDLEPPAFCYAFAENYKAIYYVRLDPFGIARDKLLSRIKLYLASKLPSMFGFTVYSSIKYVNLTGRIPFPCGGGEDVLGGHAIVAVGYDDNMKIKNPICKTETTGALLIRNSWGKNWGEKGYGWLPYDYVFKGAASDFWVLLSQKWVDTEEFTI